MFKVVKHSNQNVLSKDGINYLMIEKWSNHLEMELSEYDAIIVSSQNQLWFEEIVLKVRMHQLTEVFLKPLFYEQNFNSEFSIHTDGTFNEKSTSTARRILDSIQTMLKNGASNTFNMEQRLLQYLNTRGAALKPKKSRYSKIGYNYPLLSLFYKDKEFEIEKQLQGIANEGKLDFQLIDRVQICNDCFDSYMIYKESCPKCNSIDIEAKDIIHHFTCAHVAPQDEFENADNDTLECPKCDKHLRHIGIDYDKPSSVYCCKSCDHNFQIAQVVAECHSCDTVNPLEALIELSIHDYALTMKGVLHAEGSYQSQTTTQKPSNDFVFKQLIQQELQRDFAKDKSSFVLRIELKGELLHLLDSNYIQQLWEDISQVVKGYISNELCYLKTDDTIQLLLLDKSKVESETLKDTMLYNLNLLLKDNLKAHVQIESVLTNIKEL